MENELKQIKKQLLKGKFADFEFTSVMKANVLKEINSVKRSSNFTARLSKSFPVLLSYTFIICFFAGLFIYVFEGDVFNRNTSSGNPKLSEETPSSIQKETQQPKPKDSSEPIEHNEEIAEEVTMEPTIETKVESTPDFAEILVEFHTKIEANKYDIDNNYDFKYKSYANKNELFEQFSLLASRDVLEQIYSGRVLEKPDGLYAIPMDIHLYFDKETPYKVNKISDTEYQFVQDRYTEYWGDETLTVNFKKIDDNWIITSIKY